MPPPTAAAAMPPRLNSSTHENISDSDLVCVPRKKDVDTIVRFSNRNVWKILWDMESASTATIIIVEDEIQVTRNCISTSQEKTTVFLLVSCMKQPAAPKMLPEALVVRALWAEDDVVASLKATSDTVRLQELCITIHFQDIKRYNHR